MLGARAEGKLSRGKEEESDPFTRSYREEQGMKPEDEARQPAKSSPTLGASIRGPVGSEAAPNDESASPGADADRAAAAERDDD